MQARHVRKLLAGQTPRLKHDINVHRFCRALLMLSSTIALIATVTPFALPPLVPILLMFYFIYLYFQVQQHCLHPVSPTLC